MRARHNSFVKGKLVLNLYHVGPKDKIQVSRLDGKHIYLQALLPSVTFHQPRLTRVTKQERKALPTKTMRFLLRALGVLILGQLRH